MNFLNIILILNIFYILILDTSGLHGLPVFTTKVWGLILVLLSLILYYREPLKQNKETFIFMILLSIANTWFIFDRTILYPVLALVSVYAYLPLRETALGKLTIGMTVIALIKTILQLTEIDFLLQLGAIVFTLSLLAPPIYLSYSKRERLPYILAGFIIGATLAWIISGMSLPYTIFSVIISQSLGIEATEAFFISQRISFVISLASINSIVALLPKERNPNWISIALIGLTVIFPPMILLRTFAVNKLTID